MKKIKVATVFSGIGAFEQALLKNNIDYDIVFACDNGEREIKETKEDILKYIQDNNLSDVQINEYIKTLYNSTKKENMMKKSYFANYKITENQWYEDIRFINGTNYAGQIDMLVGGSPCQSFSIIGKRAGLADTRGTLFYDYARLIKEIGPKVFVYENVPGMITHDRGNTWKVIREVFESLNYSIHYKIINSQDFGIPQDRKRLFVVGFKDDVKFTFPTPIKLETTMFDFLEDQVSHMHYLGQKGFEFVTNPKYRNRARINKEIIQTQKANQQFNWNGDFVFEEYDITKHNIDVYERAYLGNYNGKTGFIRQLSHRECLRLMGFSDNYKIVVPNVWAYRQAGNSIVVNVLSALLDSILETGVFNKKKNQKISNSKKRMNIATVFSGIGAVEFALRRLNVESNIIFACDNGERDVEYDKEKEFTIIRSLSNAEEKKIYVDNLYSNLTRKHNYVQESYIANYKMENSLFFQDICLLDGTDFKGQVDLFVGGSPCQSFSSVGFQKGLEDARGTLFYEFARLVKEIEPKVFIYENVKNMLTHDKGNTWQIIKGVFDSLGYNIDFKILNAANFGIPQTRNRLFVVGYKKEFGIIPNIPESKKNAPLFDMHEFLLNNCKKGNFTFKENGELLVDSSSGDYIQERYFLSDAVKNYVMKEGTKTWKQKVAIDLKIARTILKTMGNCHRAGVDNYMMQDGKIRMLTEREAHRLMGFTDDYHIVVSTAQAYKQAGNSIVVDVMMEILKNIFKDDIL